jgi:dolichol-phosphate mannosyltransferase
MPNSTHANPRLSVVVPVFNEEENIRPLVEEIATALQASPATQPFEIIYVNDGSTDNSLAELRQLQTEVPQLRVLNHVKSCGQSTAVHTGVTAARAEWVATLDGDGQNVPADIPALFSKALAARPEDNLQMVAGWRTQRKDTWLKRVSSKIANAVRSRLLKDDTPDTGCGLKVFRRDTFLQLPYFDHMHRYLPALVKRAGGRSVSVPVQHRPRERGVSKYGFHNRLWVGIVDLLGVNWLLRRAKLPEVSEVTPASRDTASGQERP